MGFGGALVVLPDGTRVEIMCMKDTPFAFPDETAAG